MYRIATDLASEHGAEAASYARQAVVALEIEGATERADFWRTVSALLEDIFARRLDPSQPLEIH